MEPSLAINFYFTIFGFDLIKLIINASIISRVEESSIKSTKPEKIVNTKENHKPKFTLFHLFK